jgi:aminoglycoside 2''-phosphotransferase
MIAMSLSPREQQLTADVRRELAFLRPLGEPRIARGQNNLVLDFGSHIVRVPRHAEAAQTLARESALLARLAERLPIPVPAIDMMRVAGEPVGLYAKLPGRPIETLDALSEAGQAMFAERLALFLRALHETPDALVAELALDREDAAYWKDYVGELKRTVMPSIAEPRRTTIAARLDLLLEQADALPLMLTLKHGDFGIGNLLTSGDAVTGIIDFGSAGLGDPACDIAGLDASFGRPFVRRLIPHYPAIETMLERLPFYRRLFPLMDVAHGLQHDDRQALADGLAALSRDDG